MQEQKELTIQDIVAVFKNTREKKTSAQIKYAVIAATTPAGDLINPYENEYQKQVSDLLRADQKLGNQSELKYANGKYQKRGNVPPPPPAASSIYLGTAGEYAVMSELLFNGYNVNRMVIDDGIDIVATKNNQYYYIQVKTTVMEQGKNPGWQIDINSYNRYNMAGVKYIFVLRCGGRKQDVNNIDRNMYFVMDQNQIALGIANGYIKQGLGCISIKIKFNIKTGEPILYDKIESPANFYLNNF